MAESRGWWDRGVPVILRGAGTKTIVSNTHQAGRILLENWPADLDTEKQRAARRAVYEAMQRQMDRSAQKRARDAFEAAAKEVGISTE